MAETAVAGAPPEPAHETGAPRGVSIPRLAIGLAQGFAAYALVESGKHHAWPSTVPALFAALSLIIAFVPVVLIGGLGRIRLVRLLIWAGVAAAVLAVFAWHDLAAGIWGDDASRSAPRITVAAQVAFYGGVFVFIGHHLLGPAITAKRWIAPYATYFDWAWKDAVQIALSVAFTGVMWAAFYLGAALFRLIGIEAVGKLLEQGWFAFPATCLAFAAGVQLTDVRVGLIRGVRMVGLVLLSWLLPVMTVIAVAFVASLPFTGLTRLFGAQSAGATMLAACAVLVVLISAAHQDGAQPPHVALRWATRAAALALVPIVLIAGDAILIRITEYGLTPARIEAIACWVVAAGFAVGYAAAAVRREPGWTGPIERTNLVMAHVIALAILVVFTPVADPARLAVDDQVGRLTSGKVPPAKFDFAFLRFHAGRYGLEALNALAALKGDAGKAAIAAKAQDARQAGSSDEIGAQQTFASRIMAFPAGAAVPASFIDEDWGKDAAPAPSCYYGDGRCEAYVLDVDGDGKPEVLIGPRYDDQAVINLDIYHQGPDGLWKPNGNVSISCPAAVDAMRAGKFQLAPDTGQAIVVAGRREPLRAPEPPCAETTPGAASNAVH